MRFVPGVSLLSIVALAATGCSNWGSWPSN